MNEIGDAFAVALKRMLKKRELTISAAAKALEVSRQTFHSYLSGTLPRRKTLNKAVHMWDLKLDLGKHSFGKGAFGGEQEKGRTVPEPSQPTLWDALDSVRDEDLHVTVKRVGKVLRVDVRIEIPA
jgi:DNA-binding XRE family transcriptional regulator